MSYAHSLSLPWSISAEEERRFRRVLAGVLVSTLVLGAVVPLLPVFKAPVEREVELPPRVARLIFEPRVEPKPVPKPVEKPRPKPLEVKPPEARKVPPKMAQKPEPQPRPVPKPDPTEQARKKAAKSGLLAMQDSLADLRAQSVDPLRKATRLSDSASQAKAVQRSLVTSKVAQASGGINTAALSRDTGDTRLQARTATEVVSPVVPDSAEAMRKGSNHNASRSIEEIQVVFDRNKGAIYSLYSRELRKDPTLQGKLVVRLTIDPSGKVTRVELVSSELGMPELEHKLVQRVKMFSFEARAVETVTITYPIEFLPA